MHFISSRDLEEGCLLQVLSCHGDPIRIEQNLKKWHSCIRKGGLRRVISVQDQVFSKSHLLLRNRGTLSQSFSVCELWGTNKSRCILPAQNLKRRRCKGILDDTYQTKHLCHCLKINRFTNNHENYLKQSLWRQHLSGFDSLVMLHHQKLSNDKLM